jgi:hypothetical protein
MTLSFSAHPSRDAEQSKSIDALSHQYADPARGSSNHSGRARTPRDFVTRALLSVPGFYRYDFHLASPSKPEVVNLSREECKVKSELTL